MTTSLKYFIYFTCLEVGIAQQLCPTNSPTGKEKLWRDSESSENRSGKREILSPVTYWPKLIMTPILFILEFRSCCGSWKTTKTLSISNSQSNRCGKFIVDFGKWAGGLWMNTNYDTITLNLWNLKDFVTWHLDYYWPWPSFCPTKHQRSVKKLNGTKFFWLIYSKLNIIIEIQSQFS